jgi:HAD superfamily hydrolase (TIGR01509 family)
MKAVILDMDGLMLDTEPLYRGSWQRGCEECGFVLDDAGYAPMIGRPTDDCEAQLVRRFGTAFPLARFQTRWPELWKAYALEHGIQRMPGLDGLLAFLESRGVSMAVATSSDAEYTEFTLRIGGLAGRFGIVVTRDQVAHGKPAPDLYIEAARRLGVAAGECVALEDSEPGVLSAVAAGMRTICVPGLGPPSAAAFCVVRDLAEARGVIEGMLTREARTR